MSGHDGMVLGLSQGKPCMEPAYAYAARNDHPRERWLVKMANVTAFRALCRRLL